jgi:hypothetical protein
MISVQQNPDKLFESYISLSKDAKRDFISRLLSDTDFNQDLMDIAVINNRIDEPAVSIDEYLAKREHQRI